MSEKEIKRGYVKWTDDDGVFHKEPLFEHPELLDGASTLQKIQAEEVRRGLAEGAKLTSEATDSQEQDLEAWLADLKAAPEQVVTVADLNAPAVISSADLSDPEAETAQVIVDAPKETAPSEIPEGSKKPAEEPTEPLHDSVAEEEAAKPVVEHGEEPEPVEEAASVDAKPAD